MGAMMAPGSHQRKRLRSQRRRGEVVVPTLVLVATEGMRDEEVFLNYRLSTHVKRPDWYHAVNAEEDERRWA